MAKSAKAKVIELLESGDFQLAQIVGDGDPEEYQGCMGSLFMSLMDDSTTVKLLNSKHPLCQEDSKTFLITYGSFGGDIKILVWED